jgi:hypothetical protein
MGRHSKKPEQPSTPQREKSSRKLAMDAIVREAASIVSSEIRKMKETQLLDANGKKVPVEQLPYFVNMQDVARGFSARLAALSSNVSALGKRLDSWRKRGVLDDPVPDIGRPRRNIPSPLSSRAVVMVANQSAGHLNSRAAVAVAQDRIVQAGGSQNAAADRHKERNLFQRMSKEAGLVKGRGTPMNPVLLHATTCKSLQGKFHANMKAAYKKVPLFRTQPIRIANVDEGDKSNRAGRDGRQHSAVTTVDRLRGRGYVPLRPMALNDSHAGTSSSCQWILASGDVLAKTPIAKAPPGFEIDAEFTPPASFTAPATHGGEPFLPGMNTNYFDFSDPSCNTRVYCTASGNNNAACFAHMFMHTAYPLWRFKVPTGPLMLIYDSCHAHNWTEELAEFCGTHDVHIVKLFHNTTTRFQPLDCGFNLVWRDIVHAAQDNLIAAGLFKHAYLDRNMQCKFSTPPQRKGTRKSPRKFDGSRRR